MTELIKASAIAIVGVVLVLLFKKDNPPMALILTIAIAFVVLTLAYNTIKAVTDFVNSLAAAANISPAILTVVFKAVAISIITKLSADVCRDAQQTSIASGIELAGSFAALYIALPLFKTVMDMIRSLV